MTIRALTFDNAENVESRNDGYWYNFITKAITGTSVGIIQYGKSLQTHQNANVITFDHGYVVIHGRLIEVDDGTKLTIPFADVDKTVQGSVIIRVDLRNEPGKQVFLTTTTTKPLKQDDLNQNLSSTYEFEIATYTASNNTISNYKETKKYINSNYIETKLSNTNSSLNSIKSDLETTKSNLNNRLLAIL